MKAETKGNPTSAIIIPQLKIRIKTDNQGLLIRKQNESDATS